MLAALVRVAEALSTRPPGELKPGTVNLFARPHVRNPDGSVSTVNSMSVGIDGAETLIPGMDERRLLDLADAVAQYLRTGAHLGQFATPDLASAYARRLHDRYAAGAYDVPFAGRGRPVDPDALAGAVRELLAARAH